MDGPPSPAEDTPMETNEERQVISEPREGELLQVKVPPVATAAGSTGGADSATGASARSRSRRRRRR